MKTDKATLIGLFVFFLRAAVATVPIWLVLMLAFKLCYHQYPPLKFLLVFYSAILFGDLLGLPTRRSPKPKNEV